MSKEHLYNQLIRLGDMMGDGLHLEPDGKWISKEYASIARALGLKKKYGRKVKRDTIAVDNKMAERLKRKRANVVQN